MKIANRLTARTAVGRALVKGRVAAAPMVVVTDTAPVDAVYAEDAPAMAVAPERPRTADLARPEGCPPCAPSGAVGDDADSRFRLNPDALRRARAGDTGGSRLQDAMRDAIGGFGETTDDSDAFASDPLLDGGAGTSGAREEESSSGGGLAVGVAILGAAALAYALFGGSK